MSEEKKTNLSSNTNLDEALVSQKNNISLSNELVNDVFALVDDQIAEEKCESSWSRKKSKITSQDPDIEKREFTAFKNDPNVLTLAGLEDEEDEEDLFGNILLII